MSLDISTGDRATPIESFRGPTVPVSLLKQGDAGVVMKISGKEEVRKFLAGLGFIAGTEIKIVSFNKTGVILDVKGSRIAIDGNMATRIYVSSE
jgi:ferrous iron transport protein A